MTGLRPARPTSTRAGYGGDRRGSTGPVRSGGRSPPHARSERRPRWGVTRRSPAPRRFGIHAAPGSGVPGHAAVHPAPTGVRSPPQEHGGWGRRSWSPVPRRSRRLGWCWSRGGRGGQRVRGRRCAGGRRDGRRRGLRARVVAEHGGAPRRWADTTTMSHGTGPTHRAPCAFVSRHAYLDRSRSGEGTRGQPPSARGSPCRATSPSAAAVPVPDGPGARTPAACSAASSSRGSGTVGPMAPMAPK